MDYRQVRATRTDAAGRYVFDDLPPGATSVIAMSEDPTLALSAVRVVVPAAEGTVGAPDLKLSPGRVVEGEVLDPAGRPVAGAVVQVVSLVRSSVTLTNARGRFALPGRPDFDEEIVVSRPGSMETRRPLPFRSAYLRIQLVPLPAAGK